MQLNSLKLICYLLTDKLLISHVGAGLVLSEVLGSETGFFLKESFSHQNLFAEILEVQNLRHFAFLYTTQLLVLMPEEILRNWSACMLLVIV